MKKFLSMTLILLMLSTFFPNGSTAKAIAQQLTLTVGTITNAHIGDYIVIEGFPNDVCTLIGDNYVLNIGSYFETPYSLNGQNSYRGSKAEDIMSDWSSEARTDSYLTSIFIDNAWGVGNETNETSDTITDLSCFPSYSECQRLINHGITFMNRVWTRTPVSGSTNKVWVADLFEGTLDNTVTVDASENCAQVLRLNPLVRVASGSGAAEDPYIIIPPDPAPSNPSNPSNNDGPSITGIKLNSDTYEISEGSNCDIEPFMTFSDGSKKLLVEANKYVSHKKYNYTTKGWKQGIIVTGDEITYTSSNPDIAYINIFGKLIARKKGTAVITIKCGNWTANATVNVK